MVILRLFFAILVRNSFAVVVSHNLSMKIYQNSANILFQIYIFFVKICMENPGNLKNDWGIWKLSTQEQLCQKATRTINWTVVSFKIVVLIQESSCPNSFGSKYLDWKILFWNAIFLQYITNISLLHNFAKIFFFIAIILHNDAIILKNLNLQNLQFFCKWIDEKIYLCNYFVLTNKIFERK